MELELAIYFPNMKRLNEMEDALRYVNIQKVQSGLAAVMFPMDPNQAEYVANTNALSWLDKLFQEGLEFTRLYFGQEFCQNLIPGPNEVEQSYYYSKQLGWNYTYVTGGYLTNAGMEKVRKNLDKLKEIGAEAEGAEVVFNDWGVLRILRRDYPGFKPVLGRILNKQTRLNMFVYAPNELPTLYTDIQTPKEEVQKNQVAAYADISLNNPEYVERLHEMGVENVDMDIVPQGTKRPEDGWGMTLGYYYPWGFIATGRNCPTSGTTNPYRAYQVTEEPCPRPCQKYNCSPAIPPLDIPIIQRGTALMIFHTEYSEPYFEGKIPYERLIFEPYIPL